MEISHRAGNLHAQLAASGWGSDEFSWEPVKIDTGWQLQRRLGDL